MRKLNTNQIHPLVVLLIGIGAGAVVRTLEASAILRSTNVIWILYTGTVWGTVYALGNCCRLQVARVVIAELKLSRSDDETLQMLDKATPTCRTWLLAILTTVFAIGLTIVSWWIVDLVLPWSGSYARRIFRHVLWVWPFAAWPLVWLYLARHRLAKAIRLQLNRREGFALCLECGCATKA